MVESTCTQCGRRVAFDPELAQPGTTITCTACGAHFEIAAGGAPGAETILVPDARAARGGEGGGTMLLPAAATDPALMVKVRGFLTQEGLPPGDADYRLRSGVTVVGREQGAIRLTDAAVSARHFQVEERGSEFFLRDLESSNGTFLNGHRVRSAKLQSGDRITAGGSTFTFSVRQIIPM